MKQLPILFSTEMVQAILDGRKTQTRRIVKPQPIDNTEVDGNFFEGNHTGFVKVDGHPYWQHQFAHEFCKYGTGDLLYVRETHYRRGQWVKNGLTKTGKQKWKFQALSGIVNFRYQDNPPIKVEKNTFREIGWYKRSSLFMPKQYSRIWLKVTEVRVERLQDISEADAIAEGIETLFPNDSPNHDPESFKNYTWHGDGGDDSFSGYSSTDSAKASFTSLWFKINGAESWDANPWVWVISFEVVSTTGKPKEETQTSRDYVIPNL